jgi:hypothetical protein
LVDFDQNTNPFDPTPEAMVADSDNAVGQIIQGLSHSSTARSGHDGIGRAERKLERARPCVR